MERLTIFIRTVYKIISFRYLFGVLLMLFVFQVCVYAQSTDVVETKYSPLDTIPEEARALFERYIQKKDTAQVAFIQKYKRDKFIKRLSFHTNAVDWVTLVPNIGLEVDLKQSPRTNYSVSIFGKFNGRSTHGKLIYNVNAVRVEGRKYWRTGKYGKDKYYGDMVKILSDKTSIYYNADSLAGHSYYNDGLGAKAKELGITGITSLRGDTLDFADDSLGIKRNNFRKWLYNTYYKFRRNVTSGRTLDNPRNWRAYYLGLWAGIDNWSISLTGNGKQGKGVGAGVVAGYTLPLLPQKYPKEGSLDLDLGLAVGWKAVKYDAYRYEEETQHYVHDVAASQPSWKIVPYPIIQDIHVSLVWRFRGIKSKVDMSLVDDFYNKQVAKYEDKKTASYTKYLNVQSQRDFITKAIESRRGVMADSTSFWDNFHRRRFEAAKRINPDTVFNAKDMEEYLRIVHGVKPEDQQKYLRDQEEKEEVLRKEAEKKERKLAKELEDSLAKVKRDSIKNANKNKETLIEEHTMPTDSISEDSIVNLISDSIEVQVADTTVTATPVLQDSLPNAITVHADSSKFRLYGKAEKDEEELNRCDIVNGNFVYKHCFNVLPTESHQVYEALYKEYFYKRKQSTRGSSIICMS